MHFVGEIFNPAPPGEDGAGWQTSTCDFSCSADHRIECAWVAMKAASRESDVVTMITFIGFVVPFMHRVVTKPTNGVVSMDAAS